AKPADLRQEVRHGFGIDAELLRAAAHLHARGFELEIRIHSYGDARTKRRSARKTRQDVDLALRFDIDEDARRKRLRELAFALAGPREADLVRGHPGVERDRELAARRDVDAVDDAGHEPDERRHRIRLHRRVEL